MSANGGKTRILLADDHLVVRMGIASIISFEPDLEVVAEADTGEEAVALAAKYPRALVIGGASVYRQLLPWVDTVHVTQLDAAPPSDRYFENLDESPAFRVREAGDWQEENGLKYRFVTYERV